MIYNYYNIIIFIFFKYIISIVFFFLHRPVRIAVDNNDIVSGDTEFMSESRLQYLDGLLVDKDKRILYCEFFRPQDGRSNPERLPGLTDTFAENITDYVDDQ